MAALPKENELLSKEVIFIRTVSFLADLARDQVNNLLLFIQDFDKLSVIYELSRYINGNVKSP